MVSVTAGSVVVVFTAVYGAGSKSRPSLKASLQGLLGAPIAGLPCTWVIVSQDLSRLLALRDDLCTQERMEGVEDDEEVLERQFRLVDVNDGGVIDRDEFDRAAEEVLQGDEEQSEEEVGVVYEEEDREDISYTDLMEEAERSPYGSRIVVPVLPCTHTSHHASLPPTLPPSASSSPPD